MRKVGDRISFLILVNKSLSICSVKHYNGAQKAPRKATDFPRRVRNFRKKCRLFMDYWDPVCTKPNIPGLGGKTVAMSLYIAPNPGMFFELLGIHKEPKCILTRQVRPVMAISLMELQIRCFPESVVVLRGGLSIAADRAIIYRNR